MIWVEDTANKTLYNADGQSVFMQVDVVLSLKSALYSFEKVYPDTASADVKYTAFKSAITSTGGVIVTP